MRSWRAFDQMIDRTLEAGPQTALPETVTLTMYKNTILKQKQIVVLCLHYDFHFVRSTEFKSLPLECMGQTWRQRRLTSCQINNFHFYSTFQTSIRGTKREKKTRLALTSGWRTRIDYWFIDKGFPLDTNEQNLLVIHSEPIKYHLMNH